MTKLIAVLLADDTLLAREGWRRILETTDDIQVVGEALVPEEVRFRVQQLHPDVVLLDLKWNGSQKAGLALLSQLKRTDPQLAVIAVSAYEDLLAQAGRAGADGVLPKTFTRDQLLSVIRGVCSEPPDTEFRGARLQLEAQGYAARLLLLRPGRTDAHRYEELMAEILPFLLRDHLSDFEFQRSAREGAERWDGVAYNSSTDAFWTDMRHKHGVGQILFEFKNVARLGPQVLQLLGYLTHPLRHFGLVITRNKPTAQATGKARRCLDLSPPKVILILSDDDVLEMLRQKGNGEDATDCLKRAYFDLIT